MKRINNIGALPPALVHILCISVLLLLVTSIDILAQPVSLRHQWSITAEDPSPLFNQAAYLTTDRQGVLYMADVQNFELLRIAPDGTILKRTGRQGQGPGEFESTFRAIYATEDRIVAVTNFDNRHHEFSTELEYVQARQLPVSASSLTTDTEELVILSIQAGRETHRLARVTLDGKIEWEAAFPSTGPYFAYNQANIAVAPDGHIVTSHLASNEVRIFDSAGRMLLRFQIDGLPERAEARSIPGAPAPHRELPADKFVTFDIDVDRQGYVYVLGGDYCENRRRTIYIFDLEGARVGLLTLPYATTHIHIDREHGVLYAVMRGGQMIGSFNIEYQ